MNRFGQVLVHARLPAGVTVGFHRVGSDGEDGHTRATVFRLKLADGGGGLPAVQDLRTGAVG